MINTLHLKNFKSIKNGMGTLEFGDLTIFAGANSSGKSTVIQSILLLMQTLANRENVALQLNGDLVTLGRVEDMWHKGVLPDGDPEKRLSICFSLRDPHHRDNIISYELEFEDAGTSRVSLVWARYSIGTRDTEDEYLQTLTISWHDENFAVDAISPALEDAIRQELTAQGVADIRVLPGAPLIIEDFFPRELRIEAQKISGDVKQGNILIDPIHVEYSPHALDRKLSERNQKLLDRAAQQLHLSGVRKAGVQQQEEFLLKTVRDYRGWYLDLPLDKQMELSSYLIQKLPQAVVATEHWSSVSFFDRLKEAATDLFTQRIRYLSAYRQPPTMLFTPGMTADWSEVGVNGAGLAAALREHSQRSVRYYHPVLNVVREDEFMIALTVWLQYFDLADSIEFEDSGKLGTLLTVNTTGMDKPLDLTSVGFGVSQILPIIVQGLLTPPNSLFIVEQPEVHLHPHVQSQLAYFFFALTRANVQCIIETHSEHIVTQLRLLITKKPGLMEQVRLYFAERSREIGTQFSEVRVNTSGAISNWPDGFMDENKKLSRELLAAATQIR